MIETGSDILALVYDLKDSMISGALYHLVATYSSHARAES